MMPKYCAMLADLQTETEAALKIGDNEKINKLDERYIELWDDIISFSPQNADESEKLVGFLLNQLKDAASNGESVETIQAKLMQLYAQRFHA